MMILPLSFYKYCRKRSSCLSLSLGHVSKKGEIDRSFAKSHNDEDHLQQNVSTSRRTLRQRVVSFLSPSKPKKSCPAKDDDESFDPMCMGDDYEDDYEDVDEFNHSSMDESDRDSPRKATASRRTVKKALMKVLSPSKRRKKKSNKDNSSPTSNLSDSDSEEETNQ